MKKIKIGLTNFWQGAFQDDFWNFFVHQVFSGNFSFVHDLNQADIVLSSVFGNVYSPREKTISLIGENHRPNFFRCAYALSCDADTWDGRNFQLPFWYTRLAWPGFSFVKPSQDPLFNHGYEPPIPIESLLFRRAPLDAGHTRKFCAIIAGNPEALRTNLYLFLNGYKEVDGYGNMFSKPLKDSKFNILKNYKFSLCPENSLYPGYVTEKLFDAWVGGTLPVYHGYVQDSPMINRACFVNYYDYLDIAKFVGRIVELDQNIEKFNAIYTQPPLTGIPTLQPAIDFMRAAVSKMVAPANR